MIPIDKLSAEVIKQNMLVTTTHEVITLVIVVLIIALLYGALIGYSLNTKYKRYCEKYNLLDKVNNWWSRK